MPSVFYERSGDVGGGKETDALSRGSVSTPAANSKVRQEDKTGSSQKKRRLPIWEDGHSKQRTKKLDRHQNFHTSSTSADETNDNESKVEALDASLSNLHDYGQDSITIEIAPGKWNARMSILRGDQPNRRNSQNKKCCMGLLVYNIAKPSIREESAIYGKIQNGDVVVQVNDVIFRGMNCREAKQKMRDSVMVQKEVKLLRNCRQWMKTYPPSAAAAKQLASVPPSEKTAALEQIKDIISEETVMEKISNNKDVSKQVESDDSKEENVVESDSAPSEATKDSCVPASSSSASEDNRVLTDVDQIASLQVAPQVLSYEKDQPKVEFKTVEEECKNPLPHLSKNDIAENGSTMNKRSDYVEKKSCRLDEKYEETSFDGVPDSNTQLLEEEKQDIVKFTVCKKLSTIDVTSDETTGPILSEEPNNEDTIKEKGVNEGVDKNSLRKSSGEKTEEAGSSQKTLVDDEVKLSPAPSVAELRNDVDAGATVMREEIRNTEKEDTQENTGSENRSSVEHKKTELSDSSSDNGENSNKSGAVKPDLVFSNKLRERASMEETKSSRSSSGKRRSRSRSRQRDPDRTDVVDEEDEMKSRVLVIRTDKPLVTDYIYFLMKQLQPCRGAANSRTGVECKFCALDRHKFSLYPSKRSFASCLQNVFDHLKECKTCPKTITDSLELLKDKQLQQWTQRKPSDQAIFFDRVWARLQGDTETKQPSLPSSKKKKKNSLDSKIVSPTSRKRRDVEL